LANFNQLLADYLELYAEIVRENGHDIEYRGIQKELQALAEMVRTENIEQLIDAYAELKEYQVDLDLW
jgi:prephenate dehydrogenase